jgi:hypothetical protein
MFPDQAPVYIIWDESPEGIAGKALSNTTFIHHHQVLLSSFPNFQQFSQIGILLVRLGTMKPTALFLGLAATTSANIIFTHVPLTCDSSSTQEYNGCLRGQQCTEFGK